MEYRVPKRLYPNSIPYSAWFAFCFFGVIAIGSFWAVTSPKSIFLTSARGSQWIRLDQPFDLAARPPNSFAVFSINYDALDSPSSAVLHVMALRRFVILIDGKKIFDNGVTIANWREEYQIKLLGPGLTDGSHKLKVMVANKFGPAMVRVDLRRAGHPHRKRLEGERRISLAGRQRPMPTSRGNRQLQHNSQTHLPVSPTCYRS